MPVLRLLQYNTGCCQFRGPQRTHIKPRMPGHHFEFSYQSYVYPPRFNHSLLNLMESDSGDLYLELFIQAEFKMLSLFLVQHVLSLRHCKRGHVM